MVGERGEHAEQDWISRVGLDQSLLLSVAAAVAGCRTLSGEEHSSVDDRTYPYRRSRCSPIRMRVQHVGPSAPTRRIRLADPDPRTLVMTGAVIGQPRALLWRGVARASFAW